MHPEQAARRLATVGGLILLFVLILRGLSLSAIFDEGGIVLPSQPEAVPIQRDFTFSEDGSIITFQQGLAQPSSTSGSVVETDWYSMAVDGGLIFSGEPPPTPDIRPFLLREDQLFILVGEGISLAAGSPPGSLVTRSVLSPDGEAIAFAAHYPDGQDRLYVLYTDEKLDWLSEEETIDEIAWSPDGEQLAYLAPRENIDQLFRIDHSGYNLQQLTFDNTQKRSLQWLEDEIGITYIGIEQSAQPAADIFLVSPDGSNPRRLTNTSQREFNLSTASNGQVIAFTVRPDDQLDSFHYLYVIDPRTNEQRRVYPPYNIAALQCPARIPRGSMGEIQFNLENSSLLPAGVPVILRSSPQPLPQLGERQINASRIETVDVPPKENQTVIWPVRGEEGLTTYISVMIDRGEQFPMSEQHCAIANTYLGLPNLSFLPGVLPLSGAGMLLAFPWLRHQKKRWLWILWLVYPVIIIVIIAIEASLIQTPNPLSAIFYAILNRS